MPSENVPAPPPPELVRDLADRYRIVREIGAGAMATVYLAEDLRHGREVAVKVLRGELAAVVGSERFLNEVRITARLDHPHILTLIDSGSAGNAPYYVVPFVRGQSLRDRLRAERQLPVDEAVRITQQIASALDYAHRQGVVHRDIKPENILLQEGEAIIADFGIALALTEAGGARLTETGLALGTPYYMSPEQATGEREIDARSDVYSLAAVTYEMLAGEPPHSGPTAQSVIAKLLTERPTSLSVVRGGVSPGVDRAVQRALAKAPADRFASAGAFASALAAGVRDTAPDPRASPGPRRVIFAGALIAIAAAGAVWFASTSRSSARAGRVTLSDRRQLTATGAVKWPAISPDGKQLAFTTRVCGAAGCRFDIEVQSVGEPEARRILEGAMAVREVSWSPDRLHVLVAGTFGDREGTQIVPTQAGVPRLLPGVNARYFAGGDSLIITPAAAPDSIAWLLVAARDGIPRDSIRIAGPAARLWPATPLPGTPWFVMGSARGATQELAIIDRSGRVIDRRAVASLGMLRASGDAVWAQVLNGDDFWHQAIERLAVDARTGRFTGAADSVYTGAVTSFDVTADGGGLVYDEGVFEREVYALEVARALRGEFAPTRPYWRGSASVGAAIAPSGARVAAYVPEGGSGGTHLSITPFEGGASATFDLPGEVGGVDLAGDSTVRVASIIGGRLHILELDARDGARRSDRRVPDSGVTDVSLVRGGGMIWPATDGSGFRLQRAGAPVRAYPKPQWFGELFMFDAMADSEHVAFLGWRAAARDSLRLAVLSLADGSVTTWATFQAQKAEFGALGDGSIALSVYPAQLSLSLYRLRRPGDMTLVGTVPRPVTGFAPSADMKRAVVSVRERIADAWLSKVARP